MTIEQRFTELQAFMMRFPRLDTVAAQTVEHLMRESQSALELALTDQDRRDKLFKSLWDAIVEPPGGGVLRTGQPTRDARMMATEGIIIDHVISLWLAGPKWRRLTQDLIPIAA